VEIERPDDLAAHLGLTLPEAKRLLADLQQKNLAAQVQGSRRTELPAKQ
jgi:DNA-binding IclR family transcriptional regulator